MAKKPTPEEITRKKELVYHYKSQIYKLTKKLKAHQYQINQIQAQIKESIPKPKTNWKNG